VYCDNSTIFWHRFLLKNIITCVQYQSHINKIFWNFFMFFYCKINVQLTSAISCSANWGNSTNIKKVCKAIQIISDTLGEGVQQCVTFWPFQHCYNPFGSKKHCLTAISGFKRSFLHVHYTFPITLVLK